MIAHLARKVVGGLAAAAALYGGGKLWNRMHQGKPPAPAPSPSPSPSPSPAPTPALPSAPSTPTVTPITPAQNLAPQSLGGGVTSTMGADGIDILSGGMIGQDVTGTNTDVSSSTGLDSSGDSSDSVDANSILSDAGIAASLL